MTRRHARFLLTVAEERTLSGAAERLGVERADVVAVLSALEAQLGASVLQRTDGGLRLTSVGRDYLERSLRPAAEPRQPAPPGVRATPVAERPVRPRPVSPSTFGPAAAPRPASRSAAPRPGPRHAAPAPRRATPSRRAVLLGAGAVGAAVAGAVALGWRPRAGGVLAPFDEQRADAEKAPAASGSPLAGAALIRAENARPGSPGWVLEGDDEVPRAIEGFADTTSVVQGQAVRLFVRSTTPSFTVEAYRLGWYGGAKARLVWTSGTVVGGDQPEPTIDPDTNMVDASNWRPSITVTPDDSWVHGQYLLKLVQPDRRASYVPLVVRSAAPRSEVLVVATVTTGAAYDTWGGHSLYAGVKGGASQRATVVSLDRPFASGYGGAGWLLGGTSEIGHLLESQGVDVAYITNVDQHADPGRMRASNVIVSGSHDEYYSPEMRLGLQAAVDAGVNVMYLGANALFRKVRFEDSPLGPNRRIVNYRSASTDPETRPGLVTTNWREGPEPMPESTLTANWYESNEPGLSAPMRIVDGSAWMFTGTGLSSGSEIAEGVREEYDRVLPNGHFPGAIQILAHSPLEARGQESASDMTYATFPSGAGAFNSGTLRFQQRLGPLSPPGQGGDDGALRRLVWNLVDDFRRGPAAQRHPAVPNVDEIYSRS